MSPLRRGVLLVLALGCAPLPELDRTGAIRAGDDRRCPDGFVERLGRCCPNGSPASACPLGDGLLGGRCQQNDDCVTTATTRVCLNGQPLGAITTPSFPGGYCSESCSGRLGQFEPCANGAGFCLGAAGTGVCLRRCELPPGASQGPCAFRPNDAAMYRCVAIEGSPGIAACLPNCLAPNVNCLTNQRCVALPTDPSFGVCRPR